MSRVTAADAALTRAEMRTIMPCFGNFSMTRIEAVVDGKETEFIFDPPYRLRHGTAYAIRQSAAGGFELWVVERKAKGVWKWVIEAGREVDTPPMRLH